MGHSLNEIMEPGHHISKCHVAVAMEFGDVSVLPILHANPDIHPLLAFATHSIPMIIDLNSHIVRYAFHKTIVDSRIDMLQCANAVWTQGYASSDL